MFLHLGWRGSLMPRFCHRRAPGKWALTACKGDPADTASWRREILPLCPRCDALIREAGDKARVLKATGERWFGGCTVGNLGSVYLAIIKERQHHLESAIPGPFSAQSE